MPKSLTSALLAIFLSAVFSFPIYGQEAIYTSDTSQTVYFRFDRTDIDSTYANNRYALNALFADSFRISFIESVHIYTYSSPEGRESYNIKLSEQRASAMKKYLIDNFPLLSAVPLSFFPGGENWEGLKELVSEDSGFDEREEVLMILDKVKDFACRERLIKRLNGGKAYKYMQQHILPLLRNAMICTVRMNRRLNTAAYSLSSGQMKPVSEMREATESLTQIAASKVEVADDAAQELFHLPAKPAFNRYSALKTNLVAWAATSVNLAYEIQIGRRLSFDLPVMWSSWDLAHTPALRIFLFQPELRYWLSRPGQGHFFGLHAHVACYNLKWEEYRYQDTDYPLWGAGFSYGYALPLTDRWGMEFNFGAGYANSRYDTFHNVPNGALKTARLLHYWGITRLGLSFTYKLSKP